MNKSMIAIVVLASSIVACGGQVSKSSNTLTTHRDALGESCSADTDCTSDAYCNSSVCTAIPAASPPAEYADGQTCYAAPAPRSSCTCAARLTDSSGYPNGKVDMQTIFAVDSYDGVSCGRSGCHEYATGHLTNIIWQNDPSSSSQVDNTSSVKLAMNVASATDPNGLPNEIPLSVGQEIEIEGEYISAAVANDAQGRSVLHFSHSPCGYVNIGGQIYQ